MGKEIIIHLLRVIAIHSSSSQTYCLSCKDIRTSRLACENAAELGDSCDVESRGKGEKKKKKKRGIKKRPGLSVVCRGRQN